MHEGPLTLGRLEYYFEQERLGHLSFPNGECLDEPAERKIPAKYAPFRALLLDIYRSITGWNETGNTELPLDQILGVIAFGDSIRIPGLKIRKKYFNLFGPEIKTNKPQKIYPTHADILIVTKDEVDYAPQIIEPEIYPRNKAEIELGGVRTHLATYEELQSLCFSEEIENYGNPAIDGVVILSGEEKNLEGQLLNDNAVPHTITWQEESDRFLDGYIDFDFE